MQNHANWKRKSPESIKAGDFDLLKEGVMGPMKELGLGAGFNTTMQIERGSL